MQYSLLYGLPVLVVAVPLHSTTTRSPSARMRSTCRRTRSTSWRYTEASMVSSTALLPTNGPVQGEVPDDRQMTSSARLSAKARRLPAASSAKIHSTSFRLLSVVVVVVVVVVLISLFSMIDLSYNREII